ncbi:MAG: aldehyde dehydrogenase family protein [Eubacteriales bacterium]|nr:aldehyde dehydrogenase family protein [Eubacteriales bacterium]MDD3349420.1 aldehyde dehydrogenase family protein [Eubacteriales bacterium]
MDTKEYVSGLIEKARVAQKVFETYTQEQVDEVVKTVGKAVYDKGEELARLAIDETKMGNYDHKVMKNKGKAMAVWNYLKDKKSVGIINYIDEKGLVEVAKPMGVIGAIAPVTNPVMTPMHNAMITLKGGNAIIIAPHPSAKKTGIETTRVINEALKKIGAPENLVQCIEEPTLEASSLLMQMADVTIATGGPGMVKAAYSSGKPAYGVGAGNMQCLLDIDADIVDAVPKIITGRTYDNGVLCTCEQNFVCHESKFDEVIAEFKKNGGYYVEDPKDAETVRETFFPGGSLNKQAVGLTAPVLAKMAGLDVPEGTRVLIVKANGCGKDEILSKEKLFPILTAYTYKTFKEGVDIVNANLELEGKGHSTVIHSFTKENIEYAGCNIPVSRLLVNGVGSSGVGGAYSNGFVPTATLGCGSWGNNSISENLDYKHLINVSRIGYTKKDAKVPTPEEIWG